MAIDQTKRPLKVPPQFQLYAEEHGIFDLYHRMLQKLVVDQPDDPLEYMINWLRRESDPIPKISIIGAPSSGKLTTSKKLSDTLGAVLIEKSKHTNTDEEIVADLKDRLTAPGTEAVRRGYILSNLPSTRKQALLLQQAGIHQTHVIQLEAKKEILLGRRMGKFLDPETGNTYHNIFDWPNNSSLVDRLVKAENSNSETFSKEFDNWNREKVGIQQAYKDTNSLHLMNCDQPKIDIYHQTLSIVNQPQISEAPRIPRIIILGSVGAGKKTVSEFLCKRFRICMVDASAWIKIVAGDKSSSIGDAVREFYSENTDDAVLPDDLVVRCVADRLSRMDCQTKGWVLFNFPKNYQQAEAINMLGHRPNRVIQLDFPLEGVIERLTNRRVDPVTGKRYTLLWTAPESKEITERLLQAPSDTKQVVESQYKEYESTIRGVMQIYKDMEKSLEKPTGGILARINADQEIETVLELATSMVINPVPLSS